MLWRECFNYIIGFLSIFVLKILTLTNCYSLLYSLLYIEYKVQRGELGPPLLKKRAWTCTECVQRSKRGRWFTAEAGGGAAGWRGSPEDLPSGQSPARPCARSQVSCNHHSHPSPGSTWWYSSLKRVTDVSGEN